MKAALANYKVLVDFLGRVLGSEYEVVFHDLSSGNYQIAAIANSQISGRTVGAPLTDLALKFVIDKEYLQSDYKVNYRGSIKKGSHIRSSTMFIKDDKNRLIGMLCINHDSGKANEIVNHLISLFQLDLPIVQTEAASGTVAANDTVETFPSSLTHFIASVLEQVLSDPNIPRERLTQDEKLKIVDALNKKGIFLLKGAIAETAAQLCSSEASIYRYLSKLNKQK